MTPAAKCRRLATMLRAKAEQERDPEARAEWQYTARGYLILANQFERNGARTSATRRSHEFAISTKKRPNVLYE